MVSPNKLLSVYHQVLLEKPLQMAPYCKALVLFKPNFNLGFLTNTFGSHYFAFRSICVRYNLDPRSPGGVTGLPTLAIHGACPGSVITGPRRPSCAGPASRFPPLNCDTPIAWLSTLPVHVAGLIADPTYHVPLHLH